jgi:Ras-related protein Rab-1A
MINLRNDNKQDNSSVIDINRGITTQEYESYNYLIKVILIGDSGTGKTSIINRYINNIYTENYVCTIGVDFMAKNLLINDKMMMLQIWDTAGMERYKQITTSYYRGAYAAIVVFDLCNRSSFENVIRWILVYNEYSSPLLKKLIYLVGNKTDIVEERKITKEEIEEFIKKFNCEYYETSAKNGTGINEMFLNLCENFYQNHKLLMSNRYNNQIKLKLEDRHFNNIQRKTCKC